MGVLRGTITRIFPRWLRAADGLLFSATAQLSAAARTLRRIVPAFTASASVTAAARTLRRVTASIPASASLAAVGRLLRRALPDTLSVTGSATATARRKRRTVPANLTATSSVSIDSGARAQSTLLWADGTAAGWADGTAIQVYR
jgi:hypothetical protein